MLKNILNNENQTLSRIWLIWNAVLNRWVKRKAQSNRILIATQLLLGDCALILPLIIKARDTYPDKEIILAIPDRARDVFEVLNLVGVRWVTWNSKKMADLLVLKHLGPYEIAYVPFERWAPIWANAFGSHQIVGVSFPNAFKKVFPRLQLHDKFLTKTLAIPSEPVPISDWVMDFVESNQRVAYVPNVLRNLETEFHFLSKTHKKRVVLHIGARNANRRWLASHWSNLATMIREIGWQVIWTYDANEVAWANQIVKQNEDEDWGAKLSLKALMSLIMKADAVVCPDTGVAHLCKLTATPNVVIYGQGNPAIHGNGVYWQHSPVRNVFIEDIACRDMQKIFGRNVEGLKRCNRGPDRCANPFCQNTITPQQVMAQLIALLQEVDLVES